MQRLALAVEQLCPQVQLAPRAHFLETARYIALKPVRAGLCADPAEWRWSSFRATAGLEHRPPFLHVDRLRLLFGSADAYRAFVMALAEPCNQVA